MKVIRSVSLARARDLVASGGTVVNIGSVPEVSEKGRGNREFDAIRSGLFGDTTALQPGFAPLKSNSRGGALYQSGSNDSLSRLVGRLFTRDFEVVTYPAGTKKTPPRVMHRRIAGNDIYAVYNLPAGTECFFRSKGKAELWDPWTGERRPLYMVRPSSEGTLVRLPLSERDVQLIVFGPGSNDATVESSTLSAIDSVTMTGGTVMLWGESAAAGRAEATVRYGGTLHNLAGENSYGRVTRALTGEWEFQVQPVLDNRWGDFHWPPTPELIGPEVRRFAYSEPSASAARPMNSRGGPKSDTVSCSYGAQFWKLGPLPGIIPEDALPEAQTFDPDVPVKFNGGTYGWQPYRFSWRWGVEDDPGHQGYHGLKEEVHEEFIRLGKLELDWMTTRRELEKGGSYYCLFTGIVAPEEGSYAIERGRVRPVAIRINGVAFDTAAQSVRLNAGVNTLLLWYDKPCITYFVVRGPGGPGGPGRMQDQKYPGKTLAMDWYGDASILRFDTRFREKKPEGWYAFTSAPGMQRMHFAAYGELDVAVGGEKVRTTKGRLRTDGAAEYTVDLERVMARALEVTIRIQQKRGCYGGAAIPDPIRLECGKGIAEIGDWSRNDALYAYSGGARYRTSVRLNADQIKQKVELDLGSVVSTAEVWINGVNVGLKLSPPWVYDLSKAVREGDNSVEVLVYNTAANHYTSIPTRYRGPITSGILGPVTLTLTGRVIMREQ